MKYGTATKLANDQITYLDPYRFKGAHNAAKAYKFKDKDRDSTVHIAIGHNMQKARVLWRRIQEGKLDTNAQAAVRREYAKEFAEIEKEMASPNAKL